MLCAVSLTSSWLRVSAYEVALGVKLLLLVISRSRILPQPLLAASSCLRELILVRGQEPRFGLPRLSLLLVDAMLRLKDRDQERLLRRTDALL